MKACYFMKTFCQNMLETCTRKISFSDAVQYGKNVPVTKSK